MSIGRLAPLLLVSWVILDLTIALLWSSRLNVSPSLIGMRMAGRFVPFQADLSRYMTPQPGSSAITGNLRPTEWLPPARFTTNRLGFRNNPEIDETASPDVIVWEGDSFTYGSALDDSETLPARLTHHTGLKVFNAGRPGLDAEGLPELDWLLSRFERQPRTLVYVHLDHVESVRHTISQTEFRGWMKYARKLAITWKNTSPLSIGSKRLFKKLSDDRFLPNEYKHSVYTRMLPDGKPMVFRPYELETAAWEASPERVGTTAEYFHELREELESRGLRLHVLLLPGRYTVYGPWVETVERREEARRGAEQLNLLESELRSRGVPCLNALNLFDAEEELRTGELSYFREDNHWNPKGVDKVARALAESLQATHRRYSRTW